ncbi:MAG TPA: cell division protein ZapA [Candidatus Kapabacteria bacterium]|nr:cell division protein ZapA [Candidatus Kapabacteria bacterium]HOM05515.1 cell division protein ZapA [Candidatus Kapabacteria bacterium]HPP40036.1 cell division protein ZapA [Candidatus Kapabacteria bacterium]HPU23942.1 cell division protein ZapA [Candidatus Kapabacteria bacterium]
MKSIKVVIGGEEYSLIGEDEELIIRSANEANRMINEIKSRYDKELPMLTITTLALVNSIETMEIERRKFEEEKQYLTEELEKMREFLANYIKQNAESQ